MIPGFPEVRITVESMRHSIATAFASHLATIQGNLEANLDAVIKNFDWDREIQTMATGILRAEIEQALKRALSGIGYDRALRKALIEIALRELRKEGEVGGWPT
jgi:hypothetical protein